MHQTHRRTALAGTALATMALTFSSIGVAAQDDMVVGVPTAPTGYTELDQALNGDFAGSTVTMQTQWITAEGDDFADTIAGLRDICEGVHIITLGGIDKIQPYLDAAKIR